MSISKLGVPSVPLSETLGDTPLYTPTNTEHLPNPVGVPGVPVSKNPGHMSLSSSGDTKHPSNRFNERTYSSKKFDEEESWEPIAPVPAEAKAPPESHSEFGKPSGRWAYKDKDGNILFYVYRFCDSNGKKTYRSLTFWRNKKTGFGEWRCKALPEPRPLYNLDKLAMYPNATVILVEGEKCAEAAEKLFHLPEYVVTTIPNGCQAAKKADYALLIGRTVWLWPDNDESGKMGMEAIGNILNKKGTEDISLLSLDVFLRLPNDTTRDCLPQGWDAADALEEGYSFEMMQAFLEDTEFLQPFVEVGPLESSCKEAEKIVAVTLSELLEKDLPPRENILSPWLPKAGLCMIYAERGVGKTFFALEIAMAVAYGDGFLSFTAPKPARVLYIDGEMPANTMQERLALIKNRKNPTPNMIEPIFITPDLQEEFMLNLSAIEGQKAIAKYIEKADLIIVDNISTLCGHGKENEAQDWTPMQKWALQLRRQRKTVLFVHHAGKNGSQRGTSKREDILDTVIKLNHPYNYSPSMGACFEIHFEKARGIMGEDTTPIKCSLEADGWKHEGIEISNYQKVIELYNDGNSQDEIVESTGLSKGYVSKLVKKGKEKGEICG